MPGLINAIQNGATAQDIISGKAGAGFTQSVGTQTLIANANTAIKGISDPSTGLIALSNQVPRTNVQLLNNGLLAAKAGVSDPATIAFITKANTAADEIGKVLGSGTGTDFTIQLGQSLANPSLSKEAFNTQMNTIIQSFQNKLDAYAQQGNQGTTFNQNNNNTNNNSNNSSTSGDPYSQPW